MSELPGQLPLFEDVHEWTVIKRGDHTLYRVSDRVIDHVSWDELDEVCDECGTACTSSKECVEISGLYGEEQT